MKTLNWKIAVFAANAALAVNATAADYYRPNPQSRLLGTNQGNVGSCQSEAEVAALESVFSSKNLPVRLSPFYRHVKTWAGEDLSKNPDVMQKITDADRQLVASAGDFVPDYMWPEVGEGFNPSGTGIRPSVSEAAIIDPEFPTINSLGFTRTPLTFKPGHSNSGDLNRLKAEVAAGKAVTVSMHGALMFDPNFNQLTGLISKPYRKADMEAKMGRKLADKTTHAMAVVGFDDALYADHGYRVPGALIVRNSWNSAAYVKASGYGPFPSDVEKALNSFRYRLHPSLNLPGYYAIPYDYFLDMAADGQGWFYVMDLNYSAYADAYSRFQNRYEVLHLPFVCEGTGFGSDIPRGRVKAFGEGIEKLRSDALKEADRKALTKELLAFLRTEAKSRSIQAGRMPLFKYATVPVHSGLGINRAVDFYQGKFAEYYCGQGRVSGQPRTGVWPYASHFQSGALSQAFAALSANPGSVDAWFKFIHGLYSQGAHNAVE